MILTGISSKTVKMMTDMLTTTQLKKLSEHKYSAEGFSISEPFMQKFWRWLVEQIPLWWAPNAITLLGLILNLGTSYVDVILVVVIVTGDFVTMVTRVFRN